jgi:hypothetical protein
MVLLMRMEHIDCSAEWIAQCMCRCDAMQSTCLRNRAAVIRAKHARACVLDGYVLLCAAAAAAVLLLLLCIAALIPLPA